MQANLTHLTFGAEFEVILPARFSHATAAVELSRISGLQVEQSSRVSRVGRGSQTFRVVHDGSVNGAGIAAEFVSPILRGQDGLDKIAAFARALASIGATVNASCGFHVHVGGFHGSIGFFKNIVKLYSKFEQAIDTVMPVSRRANNYCRSLRVSPSLETASSLDQIILATTGVSPREYGARFFKLNLAAYTKHSTVEFRQHAGTVDAVKAVNWIKTCLRIVAAAEQGKTGAAPAQPGDFSSLPEKARVVASFITRPEGATREEIVAAHPSFRALSVNRQARIAGLAVEVRRERGRDRFFAAIAATGAEIAATLSGLFQVIEAPAEEASYFASRAVELQQRAAA